MTLVVTHTTVTGAAADSTALVDGPAWDANHTLTGVVSASQGGTGIVNNDASTITISGSFGITFTISAATSLTLPTSGTVATTSNKLSAFAATTSAELAGVISDETGSGALVFATSPTLVTPTLGSATATSINKVAITAPATSATLTLIDGTTVTGPAASGTIMTLGNAETVTGAKTFNDAKLLLAGSSSGTTTLKASATASGTVTLPAATDTLVGKATTDTLTNKTLDSAGTGNVLKVSGVTVSAGQYPGETSTSSATAGNVGEVISASVALGSAVALTTGAIANITSISLTAGDWDIWGSVWFSPAASTSITRYGGSIETTSGGFTSGPPNSYIVTQAAFVPGLNNTIGFPCGPVRASLSGTTSYFLNAVAVFTVSTLGAFGTIRARRVR